MFLDVYNNHYIGARIPAPPVESVEDLLQQPLIAPILATYDVTTRTCTGKNEARRKGRMYPPPFKRRFDRGLADYAPAHRELNPMEYEVFKQPTPTHAELLGRF